MIKKENFGTPEGRRLGGQRSLTTHRLKKTGFNTLRKVRFPRPSARLAELLGIFYGDGHVGVYQASVVTSSETDREHAFYVKELIEKLFKVPVSLSFRRDKKACVILVSSKEVCRFLQMMGMPAGNKIVKGIRIPEWVQSDIRYSRFLLRGLIDTDGCVYEDRHTVKGNAYTSTCIAFTSASSELIEFVYSAMKAEGYTPTRWGRNVRLRRQLDVQSYAKHIGFSNPKHAMKIRV